MQNLAHKIEFVINEILLYCANHNEILICDALMEKKLTNTQKHILMLLKKYDLTNKELAQKLRISQAAVTKAIKSLIQQNMINAEKDLNDGRILRYKLSKEALFIAQEHENHHIQTLKKFETIVSKYSLEEREVVDKFLNDLIEQLGK